MLVVKAGVNEAAAAAAALGAEATAPVLGILIIELTYTMLDYLKQGFFQNDILKEVIMHAYSLKRIQNDYVFQSNFVREAIFFIF